ncbi:hypothetical protein ACLB2K_039520 [Fragaria x ananassa]
MDNLWEMIRKPQEEDDEDDLATSAAVIAAVAHHKAQNQPPHRGSLPGRRPNQPREREDRGKGMLQDYFVERPIFSDEKFRVRYRMSHKSLPRDDPETEIVGGNCNRKSLPRGDPGLAHDPGLPNEGPGGGLALTL